jgi:coenzyme F420-reducing hydrogenase beta subunit
MNADGFKQQIEESKAGFDALRKVIEFSCSSCGLCVSLCPTEAIEMQETVPTLVGNCTQCGFCYQGCPRSFFPLSKVKNRYFGPEHTEVEMRVGRCVERFTSRALADDIFDKGANGGTVTALLHYLLEKNIVDAVLHLGRVHTDRYLCNHAFTIISTRPEDVLRGSGARKQITPMLQDLKKMGAYGCYALVGLSCNVQAIRKLQTIKDDPELREMFKGLVAVAEKLLKPLKFVIGMNCFSSTKAGAFDKIYEKLGIREEDIIKYGDDTKKSLYQYLNEGKNFFWFVQDNFMTRDGRFFPFNFNNYLDEAVFMGCMVCPSLIVCKEADVSIGVTASELKLTEYGYNSVMVRNPELNGIFNSMVAEGKLLKRPMWDNRGSLLRKFVERLIPAKDLMNIHGYVATRTWNPPADLFKSAESAYSARILGLQRLFLTQTVKRKIMFEPAIKALRECQKHYTENL